MRKFVHDIKPGPLRIVALAAVGLMAGCSSSVTRLDSSPSFAFNDPPGTNSVLRPSVSMARSGVGARSVDTTVASGPAYQPYSVRTNNPTGSDVEVAALPDPVPAAPQPYPPSEPRTYPSYTRPTVPPAASAPPPSEPRTHTLPPSIESAPGNETRRPLTAEQGEAIEVRQGDTLYGLAKRHKVSLSELMQVNGLTTPDLKPGQTIHLPKRAQAPLQRPKANSVDQASTAPVPVELAAKYTGSYTVRNGDSLYGLAIKMKVPMTELKQVNGITDVHKVRPGTVLKVPASAMASIPPTATAPVTSATSETGPAVKVPTSVVSREVAGHPAATSGAPKRPTLLNGESQVVAADPAAAEAPAQSAHDSAAGPAVPPAASAGKQTGAATGSSVGGADIKLRWPVRGRVIAGFGPRPDGTHNDGVNLQVPQGTEVHAAESGVVAYAGSELKGYGNLVLVRHDNGWITAYAHNAEIVAKRGDRVKRGQVIAKSGKSGQVDLPQVHFELRQSSKPVDPTPFMERL